MKTGQQELDRIYNENWDSLLKMFHAIVEKQPKDQNEQLEKLKEFAKTKQLSPRQIEGIIERCDNVIKGNYGNTKKPEHYNQQHNFSTNGKQ